MGCTQVKSSPAKNRQASQNQGQPNNEQNYQPTKNNTSKQLTNSRPNILHHQQKAYNQQKSKLISRQHQGQSQLSNDIKQNSQKSISKSINQGVQQLQKSGLKSGKPSLRQIQSLKKSKDIHMQQLNDGSQTDKVQRNQKQSLSRERNLQNSKLYKSKSMRKDFQQHQHEQNDKSEVSAGNLDDAYLGMESKVDRNYANSKIQKVPGQNQRINATSHLQNKNLKKVAGQSIEENDKLFHSQHQVNSKKALQKYFPQSHTNIKIASSKKDHKSHIEDINSEINRSMKSEIITKNNHAEKSDLESSQSNTQKINVSLVQEKKGFEERLNESARKHPQKPNNQHSINKLTKMQTSKHQDKKQDYLLQQNDQQGIVKIPIETQYHANSKHTIQFSAQQQMSMKSSKIADKYLKSLQNKIISQQKQSQRQYKEEDQRVQHESSSKYESQYGHKRQSRIDTAFFKHSADKNQQFSQKQNSNGSQKVKISEQKMKETVLKKKNGPILFSQISFQKNSDFIPDEQRFQNDLEMSVHLNLTQNF